MGKEKNSHCPTPYYRGKRWYAYNGLGDIYDPTNYRSITISPTCERGNFICAIYVKDGGILPVSISLNVQQYIANALVSNLPQPPKIGKRTKNFVYLKN